MVVEGTAEPRGGGDEEAGKEETQRAEDYDCGCDIRIEGADFGTGVVGDRRDGDGGGQGGLVVEVSSLRLGNIGDGETTHFQA